MDVAGEDGKVLVFVHKDALIPSMVQVAYTIVSSIVVAGIGNIEFAHELGKVGERRFYQQVKVIVHEYVTMEFYSVNIKRLGEELEELTPICVVLKDVLPFVSAAGDVFLKTISFTLRP
ncbi:MAG: hypothetical protein WA240_05495 [Nitrospirota bacterium]